MKYHGWGRALLWMQCHPSVSSSIPLHSRLLKAHYVLSVCTILFNSWNNPMRKVGHHNDVHLTDEETETCLGPRSQRQLVNDRGRTWTWAFLVWEPGLHYCPRLSVPRFPGTTSLVFSFIGTRFISLIWNGMGCERGFWNDCLSWEPHGLSVRRCWKELDCSRVSTCMQFIISRDKAHGDLYIVL